MSKYRVKVNGKVYEMEIEPIVEQEESVLKAQSYSGASFKNSSKADPVVQVINPEAEKQTIFDNNTVMSPMPGSIVKVLVSEGDKVSAEQTVLVLEAMKMENEIGAPKAGTIKKIYVKEGHTVQGNAPLFEIDSEV